MTLIIYREIVDTVVPIIILHIDIHIYIPAPSFRGANSTLRDGEFLHQLPWIGWRWHPKQLQTFFPIFDPNLQIFCGEKKCFAHSIDLWPLDLFVKKNGPNWLIEFFFGFIVSKTLVFLRCYSSTPLGIFCSTHPPVGAFQAAQEMAELNLLDASRRSLLGTPSFFFGEILIKGRFEKVHWFIWKFVGSNMGK